MSNSTKFSCVIDTTDSSCPLGMEICLDDQQIFNTNHVTGQIAFEHDIDDAEGQHELIFVMKGKTSAHTKIDADGQITADARLILKDLSFDGIELGHMLSEQAVYTHDFNGTGPMTQDQFYQEIGCNGQIKLEFSTPFYLWLLEHM